MKYTQPGKKCDREFHSRDAPMLIIMVFVLTRLKHYFISIHIALKDKKTSRVIRTTLNCWGKSNKYSLWYPDNPKPT